MAGVLHRRPGDRGRQRQVDSPRPTDGPVAAAARRVGGRVAREARTATGRAGTRRRPAPRTRRPAPLDGGPARIRRRDRTDGRRRSIDATRCRLDGPRTAPSDAPPVEPDAPAPRSRTAPARPAPDPRPMPRRTCPRRRRISRPTCPRPPPDLPARRDARPPRRRPRRWCSRRSCTTRCWRTTTRTSTSSSSCYNRADFAFDVGGWKLGGEVTFTIPAGTRIPARGFLVVAKNRTALLAVTSYALDPAATLGDYTGQLDNAGGLLVLLDAAGAVVDSVGYDDRFPWPIAADALGASDNWLPPALLPLTAHRTGASRWNGSATTCPPTRWPTGCPPTWTAPPRDGPTPLTGTPPAIVETLSAGTGQRPAADPVRATRWSSAPGCRPGPRPRTSGWSTSSTTWSAPTRRTRPSP